MNITIWLTFVFAAAVLLIIPGPTILLVVSQAMAHGRRAVLPLVIGVTLGDFTAMVLSLLGLGAILASSAELFSLLKWIGALYLVYIGIRLWREDAGQKESSDVMTRSSGQSLVKSAYIVTALNPKSIAFFVAFLPQFINSRAAALPQFIILGATFLFLAAVNAALYAIFAGKLRDKVHNPAWQRWFNRCGGSVLIGAGVFTATLQRSS